MSDNTIAELMGAVIGIIIVVAVISFMIGRATLGDDAHATAGHRLKCDGAYVAVEVASGIILEGRECREVKR